MCWEESLSSEAHRRFRTHRWSTGQMRAAGWQIVGRIEAFEQTGRLEAATHEADYLFDFLRADAQIVFGSLAASSSTTNDAAMIHEQRVEVLQ